MLCYPGSKSKFGNCTHYMIQNINLMCIMSFSYTGHENPTDSVVLDFLSGTTCLVLTSGALVLSLFTCHGYEKNNLLPVV